MKAFIKVLVAVLIIAVALSFAKDIVIKTSVEKGVTLLTGLKLGMSGLKVGILSQVVDIKGLKIFNPEGYTDKIMLNMPVIYVSYDLASFFSNKIHIKKIKLDLEEFVVVKNANGEVNLDSLKGVQAGKKTAKKEEAKPQPGKAMQIDELDLKVGKVVYKDYSAGAKPSIQEINVNINEKFTNITNPAALVSIIVVKSLMNTTIANLANVDIKALQGPINDTLKQAQAIIGDTAKLGEKTKEIQKNIANLQKTLDTQTKGVQATATDSMAKVQEEAKKKAEALTGMLKGITQTEQK